MTSGIVGAGWLAGCRKADPAHADAPAGAVPAAEAGAKPGASEEQEVSAPEDLMREHGVIRRVLVVYREAAARLRSRADRDRLPFDALSSAAKLLRSFGEDYHEKQLEEAHIFPALRRTGAAAQGYVDALIAQHDRGRQISDFVIATAAAPLDGSRAESLASALVSFARMYEEHAAFEDTVVFPAWKRTMTSRQLDEAGELFEELEHKSFGKDAFDDAVAQLGQIERAFGFELAAFLAPPPPK